MADYISGYTGAEIDLSVSSGSTKSGKVIDNTLISGSATSTGSFGYLSVVGNAIISGNLTIGDSDGDNVAFVADLSSSLTPEADSAFDIGTTTKRWKNAHIDDIHVSNHISASGGISSSNARFTGNVSASGTTTVDTLKVSGPPGGAGIIHVNDGDTGYGSDEALKVSTQMLCHMAEKENGEKAFGSGDAVRLQREIPESVLNELELFLFNVTEDGIPLDEAKND